MALILYCPIQRRWVCYTYSFYSTESFITKHNINSYMHAYECRLPSNVCFNHLFLLHWFVQLNEANLINHTKLLDWKIKFAVVFWAIKNCSNQMNIVVYGYWQCVCVCVCWAPLLHSCTYQTNEYWIIIRQIVNSSSNVLSNSTCVFVTWSCYACTLYFVLSFVVVALAVVVECRIPFAARCIVAYCYVPPHFPPAANNSMTLQSYAFSIQCIHVLYILLFSSQLVRSHAMSVRTLIYYVNLDTKQLTIFWCIFLSSFLCA